jgi:hypothetical protein
MERIESSRTFRVWDWSVSHCRLLLRCARSPEDPGDRNVDIAFYGVSYMELPDTLAGVKIREASREEEAPRAKNHKASEGGHWYAVESSGQTYLVGAVNVEMAENRLPPMESSFWRPGGEWDPRWRVAVGELLRRALIEIRAVASQGKAQQAGDLADAVHELPARIDSAHMDWALARHCLREYQREYPRGQSEAYFEYLAILDEAGVPE